MSSRTPMQAQSEGGEKERELNLMSLIHEKRPIWVINRSMEKLGQPLYIYLSLREGGPLDPIPPGRDPICLTDKVPHKYLETSTELFRLVDKGILELVDPDEAADYYKKHPERKEVVRSKIESVTASSSEGGVPGGFRSLIGRRVMHQPEGAVVAPPGRFEPTPRVKWLANAFKANIISADAFKIELESLMDTLSEVDKAFLNQELGKSVEEFLKNK